MLDDNRKTKRDAACTAGDICSWWDWSSVYTVFAAAHVAAFLIFKALPLSVHAAVYAFLCLLPNVDTLIRTVKGTSPPEAAVLGALIVCGMLWTVLGNLLDNGAIFWPSLFAYVINSGSVGFIKGRNVTGVKEEEFGKREVELEPLPTARA